MNSIRPGILRIIGYLIPLVQSLPSIGIWTGLMTLPFFTYLILLFRNIPVNLPRAFSDFLIPILIPEKVFIFSGFLILLYSIGYLIKNRKEGLIVSGPYSVVRHPQYLGIILLTIGFTSWSVWILKNTFGIGYLNPIQTIGVWFFELFAYVILAYLEDFHLANQHEREFMNYRTQVSFFIPLFRTDKRAFELLISILIPSILLLSLISFN
jgi:protein-S-isoprenylcysteine O-methyltransferase Ste14